MAASNKLLLFWVLSSLIVTQIASNLEEEDDDSSLNTKVDQLRTKIASLELGIKERSNELRNKDERITIMEMVIQEQSDNISLLQSDIDSLHSTGSAIDKEHNGKAYEQLIELDTQVGKLQKQIELQNKKNDAMEIRASMAEKKILELNSRLEDLSKVNDEQKIRIRKAEQALKVTKEEMLKTKSEAASMLEKLPESYILIQWKNYWKPALDFAINKVIEKKVQLGKFADIHIRTMNSKWIPMMKEKWLVFITHLQPLLRSLTSETIKVCHSSIDLVRKILESVASLLRSLTSKTINTYNSPMDHVLEALDLVEPYIQGFGKFVEPFMNQVVVAIKSNFDKAYHVMSKPYMRKTDQASEKLIESANAYNLQEQETLRNKLTRSIASIELVWFLASALLILSIIIFFKTYFVMSSKTVKRSHRRIHTHHRTQRHHLHQVVTKSWNLQHKLHVYV